MVVSCIPFVFEMMPCSILRLFCIFEYFELFFAVVGAVDFVRPSGKECAKSLPTPEECAKRIPMRLVGNVTLQIPPKNEKRNGVSSLLRMSCKFHCLLCRLEF